MKVTRHALAAGWNRFQWSQETTIRNGAEAIVRGMREETPNGPAYRMGDIMYGVDESSPDAPVLVTVYPLLVGSRLRQLQREGALFPKPGSARHARRIRLEEKHHS